MHSKRRSPAFPSWLDPQPLWIERERYLWLARERSVALWMHRAAARAWVVRFLDAVSRIGDGWLWYAVIVCLPWAGGASGPSASVRMIAVGIVDLVVYKIIKRWIARPRPYCTCPGIRACARSLDEFSFPSGHTLHSVAFSLILTVYYPMFALCRLAAHGADRRVARRPGPALSERRHRRRADRRHHRGRQLQPALVRSRAASAFDRR